jgi:heptose I phosphotransferase
MQVNPTAPATFPAPHNQAFGEWLPLSGRGSGFVRRDWQPALSQAGLNCLEDFMEAVGDPLVKSGLGERYRARLSVEREKAQEIVYLKRYGRPALSARIASSFDRNQFDTPARRDFETARSLAGLGIAVPEPLAWGWAHIPNAGKRSFILSRAVPGEAVDAAVAQPSFSPDPVQAFRKKQELVHELGLLIRKFHELGWCHRDFYLCHVFVSWLTGKPHFSIIDLQRAFRPRWRVDRWRVKDLAQLNYSAKAEHFTRAMRLRFARAYFGDRDFSALNRTMLRRVQAKTKLIAQRDRARRA